MKRLYIGTLVSLKAEDKIEGMPENLPQMTQDKVIIAENVSEVEAIVGTDYKIERLVNVENWIMAESIFDATGEFYMADTKYLNQSDAEVQSMQFFLRAESLTELEATIEEECGETFRSILSIEKSPYEVLGL